LAGRPGARPYLAGRQEKESIYAIYLVDSATQRLIQALSLRDLVVADPTAHLDSITGWPCALFLSEMLTASAM
jgi:Mg/Co/Ni transporter MgtE